MATIDLQTLLKHLFQNQQFILAVLSSPNKIPELPTKIQIKPIPVKGELLYQMTEFKDQKAYHKNVDFQACQNHIEEWLKSSFKRAVFYATEADYHILVSQKGKVTIIKKPATKAVTPILHDRKKKYLIEPGQPIPFLVELGVLSREGKVIAKMADKFRQINRFLELVDDLLPPSIKKREFSIIDFGCGKAYLTFALHYLLRTIHGCRVDIVGLDLKPDVVANCQALAQQLHYDDLHFEVGDINSYQLTKKVDMVVSLHACDTATDAALEKAIRWGAEYILCVPCCQNELYSQVENLSLKPLLKHGILKERFAALATDAARAQLLEILGYHTQIVEFIDLEHTPKNLLIRAVKKKSNPQVRELLQAYLDFKKQLQIFPSLEKRFQAELNQN